METTKIAKAIENDFLTEQRIVQKPGEFVKYFLDQFGLKRANDSENTLLNVFYSKMHIIFHLYQDCKDEYRKAGGKDLPKEQFIAAFKKSCKKFNLHARQSDPIYIERVLRRILVHRSVEIKPYLGTELNVLVPYTSYLIGKYGYKKAYIAMAQYILPNHSEEFQLLILSDVLSDNIMDI